MPRRRTAFTLIELLVVISILGLLISILLPTLSAARQQAKAKVCLSNLKTLGTAVAFYVDENDEKLPPFRLKAGTPDGDPSTDAYRNEYGREQPRWHWFLQVGDGPVIEPPRYRPDLPFNDDFGTTMANAHFVCPALPDEFASDIRDGAYGYNYQYLGNARTDTIENKWDNFPVGSHRVRAAGQTILFADSRGAGRLHGRHSYTLDPPRLAVERNAARFGPSDGDVADGINAEETELYRYSPAEARHNKLANVVFFDTHAEAMSLKQLGYQFTDAEDAPGSRDIGVAKPIRDPLRESYTASNVLWTGVGKDPIAAEHRP